MDQVMVIAENNSTTIHPVTYELLKKGRELAEKLEQELVAGLLSGSEISTDELIYRGADKVYYSIDKAFSKPIETIHKQALQQIIQQINPKVILIGATNFGRSLAPRIAMSLDASLTADCTGLDIDEDGNFIQIRPAFSGNILAHIKSTTRPQIATVRYREFEEAPRDETRKGETLSVEVDLDYAESEKINITGEDRGRKVNLEDSEIVVSGGRGLKDAQDLKLLTELAEVLDGVVGASRPLVDEGWIERAHQVGYSGRRVKPKVYIACGISGQSQHLAGMKESDTIIAINSDPSAPIFEYADYGIVGDLYQVIPELTKQLKEG